jgi:NADPH:quinone reductase-like Zn-dependent oxidoreductase
MSTESHAAGLQLRSLVSRDGTLKLTLDNIPNEPLRENDILVRLEASPINPSDLGLLLGGADLSTARTSGTRDNPVLTAKVSQAALAGLGARLDKPLPVGNEGAGVVVKTGESETARALLGKTVAVFGGSMYAQYRRIKADDCVLLPEGTTPAEGASCFVNPLTALGMVETMRRENHSALVHTAAASNLGQMLNKICIKDGVSLVNIVRNQEQAAILRAIGAKHVCDSSAASFITDLTKAIGETGATLAFDAIGGGLLADQILTCMEAAANANATSYNRYGSSTHKQLYTYGRLNTEPTILTRNYGSMWGVGGWLLTPFLQKIGRADVNRLRARVAAEVKTTFASKYTKTVSLADVLQVETLEACSKRATGEKYLINPAKT